MLINTPSPVPQSIESCDYVINIIVCPCIWKEPSFLLMHYVVAIRFLLCTRRFWDICTSISGKWSFSKTPPPTIIIFIFIRTISYTCNQRRTRESWYWIFTLLHNSGICISL